MSLIRLIFCLILLAPHLASAATDDDATWTGEPKIKIAKEPAATNHPLAQPTPPTPAPAPPILTTTQTELAPPPTESAKIQSDDRTATLTPDDLQEYDSCSDAVKQLISQGLTLTTLKLAYHYGSSDPKSGGMDCSGTIYYLLKQSGLRDVPRDASEMYKWVWTQSRFEAVVSSNPGTFELDKLKPGDLLFWTGTYSVTRDPPVTHVMLYLGHNVHNGHRVMMGASEGRTYAGKSRYGVSVFDFTLPRLKATSEANAKPTSDLQSRFIGYGPVPNLDQALSSSAAR